MPRPLYPRERPPAIVKEAGCAPGPVWTGADHTLDSYKKIATFYGL